MGLGLSLPLKFQGSARFNSSKVYEIISQLKNKGYTIKPYTRTSTHVLLPPIAHFLLYIICKKKKKNLIFILKKNQPEEI